MLLILREGGKEKGIPKAQRGFCSMGRTAPRVPNCNYRPSELRDNDGIPAVAVGAMQASTVQDFVTECG